MLVTALNNKVTGLVFKSSTRSFVWMTVQVIFACCQQQIMAFHNCDRASPRGAQPSMFSGRMHVCSGGL